MFGRKRKLDDFSAEIEAHLQLEIDRLKQQGLSEEEARTAACCAFGNVTQARERFYESRRWLWWDHFWQDLRFGLRMLRKNSAFAAVAMFTLALGIGANTAIFSVIDTALLNPIPFPQPNCIVVIYSSWPQFPKAPLSYPNFLDLQRENHSFRDVAVWRIDWFTLTGSGDPERLTGEMVSANFLSVLGVRPIIGRSFRPDEDRLGAAPVAMLGEGLWKRHFGSDPNIIGESVTLDGKSYSVVGIAPSSVRLLHFQDSYFDEIFVPVGQWSNPLLHDRRFSLGLRTVGRLKAGVTLTQAQAEMQQVQSSLSTAYPNINAGLKITVDRLRDDQIGDIQPMLLMLWGSVGLVMLIALRQRGKFAAGARQRPKSGICDSRCARRESGPNLAPVANRERTTRGVRWHNRSSLCSMGHGGGAEHTSIGSSGHQPSRDQPARPCFRGDRLVSSGSSI
jgi:MacB-like periplasmic core domain